MVPLSDDGGNGDGDDVYDGRRLTSLTKIDHRFGGRLQAAAIWMHIVPPSSARPVPKWDLLGIYFGPPK